VQRAFSSLQKLVELGGLGVEHLVPTHDDTSTTTLTEADQVSWAFSRS
jgi:hypothetical protein